MKILIDTPIWSKAFRRRKIKSDDKAIVDVLKYLIDEFMEVIIGPIRQELLSGISDEKVFNELKEKMEGFNDFPIETKDYELAAEYSNICRRNGIQGSNTDFLICAISVRNNFEIYTMDDDFNQYKQYLPIKIFDIKTIGRFA
ncbi:PIN domain-containing protein [Treponema sp. TIM-1]|uniref:PIN domain-containing protein n=1 Tax=Treponema sp. TIM-1 TaxID=2898417 RepID=UPI00398097DE